MSVRIVVASTDRERISQVAAAARAAGGLDVVGTVHVTELAEAIAADQPDALLLDAAHDPQAALAHAHQLTVVLDDLAVVLLADERADELAEAARASGIARVVQMPAEPPVISEAVTAARADARGSAARGVRNDADHGAGRGHGTVVSVGGAKGGVGVSTIATQLAMRLQSRDGVQVALVELDLQTGDVRAMLDVSHGATVRDLISSDLEDDAAWASQLERALHHHRSGVQILLAPKYGEQADDVDAATVRRILASLVELVDVVVVDAGAVATEANATATRLADDVVLVMTPDVPALRGANRLLGLWERLQVRHGDVRVLVNRFSPSAAVQPDFMRRVAEADMLDTMLPADFAALDAATNAGVPGAIADGPLQASLDALADELRLVAMPAPAPTAAPRRRRRWRP